MSISNSKSSADAFQSSLNAARKQAIMAGTPYVITKQFPWKLHEMLDVVEQRGETSIVSWLPGGRAFRVHNPGHFVEQIMKKCFNQTKYKSFQRQLNLWGFERIVRESAEKGSYFHPLFLRGRRDLCQEMARQKVKSEKKPSKQTTVEPQHPSSAPEPSLNTLQPPVPTTTPPTAPTTGVECVSTDVSNSSSASSSPTQTSSTASLMLSSTLPHQQLLPPTSQLSTTELHNSLHILKAIQAANNGSLPSTGSLAPPALPMSVVTPATKAIGAVLAANKPTIAGAAAANIPNMAAISRALAGIRPHQDQHALENSVLLHALESQEAQRASSVFLAAALLGNLASSKNSS